MILQGNQRGGAKDLALHLLKEENEHVEVHDLRGFMSDDLVSALNEAHAISQGTRAKQFLFSLSLNPPKQEKVDTQTFENAIERVENKLGLSGQPRAIVFHEKNGRRHAHAVWSRIDTQAMKAIPLPFTKRKLMEISRELYIEHDWNIPPGMTHAENRNPSNFTLAQWQQAKRNGEAPRAVKQAFQSCWAQSDSRASFENALKEQGYRLAKGDRRGFVALNHRCEPFAIPKWVGVKTKDVRAKLGSEDDLPSVAEVRKQIADDMQARLNLLQKQQANAIEARAQLINDQLRQLVTKQRQERQAQRNAQEKRWQQETLQRQARFLKGLRGILDRVTGKHRQTVKRNKQEAENAKQRDRQEKDGLIFKQADQRQTLVKRMERLHEYRQSRSESLSNDIAQYRDISQQKQDFFQLRKQTIRKDPTIEH